MATNYVFNNREHKFILKEWLNTEKLAEFERFKGYYDVDDVDMLLDVVLEIATEVVAPTVEDGEENPMRLEDGRVTVPDSFRSAYKFLVDNGWGPSNANEQEGVLPQVVFAMCEEFLGAANYPLMQFVGLTSGSAGLIQSFGHQEVQDLYLPKMFSGQWAGTMCQLSPEAGLTWGTFKVWHLRPMTPGYTRSKALNVSFRKGTMTLRKILCTCSWPEAKGALLVPKAYHCLWCQNTGRTKTETSASGTMSPPSGLNTRWV